MVHGVLGLREFDGLHVIARALGVGGVDEAGVGFSCGDLAQHVGDGGFLAGGGDVDVAPASEESAVTDVLGKVTAGEADAGLVYATDAQGAGDDVETVEFAEAEDAVNHYPIASLQDSENPLASEFVDFILEEPSQELLREAGFASP